MKLTLQELSEALQASWSADTAYSAEEWSQGNKARGQCVISSLVVQDYFGGELLPYSIDEGTLHETHYVNRLDDGTIIDTTASQYRHPVNMRVKSVQLSGSTSIREKRLADASTQKRYEILKKRVERLLG